MLQNTYNRVHRIHAVGWVACIATTFIVQNRLLYIFYAFETSLFYRRNTKTHKTERRRRDQIMLQDKTCLRETYIHIYIDSIYCENVACEIIIIKNYETRTKLRRGLGCLGWVDYGWMWWGFVWQRDSAVSEECKGDLGCSLNILILVVWWVGGGCLRGWCWCDFLSNFGGFVIYTHTHKTHTLTTHTQSTHFCKVLLCGCVVADVV